MNRHPLSEEQIFEAAFRIEPHDARVNYLKQACRDDEQIDRVLALLMEGAPEASFLEGGPASLRDVSNPTVDTPKSFGDFEILGELGRGGMGVVYRARQRSLNRLVALKVLSTGLGLTTKAIMRFKREAEAAAKLHHTNIVPIYWTGDENRIPYYAMELIEGPSLDQVIRQLRADSGSARMDSHSSTYDASMDSQGPIPAWVEETIGFQPVQSPNNTKTSTSSNFDSSSSMSAGNSYFDTVARMMAGVADALAHAHDHGIIHRDIKPANLLLSSDGVLSINDFGLARMLEQPGMTMTGEFMGSPMYMSPEQIAAGRLPLDHRTDIYSLGASLYQLLTLEPPFPGQQRDQVLSQIVHKDPPPPRSIKKQIPKDLETICLKAMEKDPDRRYQTADLMAEDLRRFVSRHAISARRIGLVERGVRWARKNKAVTVMACLTLMVVVSAASFVYLSYRENLMTQRMRERDKLVEKALTAAMIGKPELAANYIDEAKTYISTGSWSHIIDSLVHRFRGEVAYAREDLEIAVGLDDSNLAAQYMLAEAYHANGDVQKHEEKLNELSTRNVAKPIDKLFKGQATLMFRYDEALRGMDEAIVDSPGFHMARLMRAHVRVFRGTDQNDENSILQGLRETETVSVLLGEENPVLNQTRLVARLAAYRVFQNKGDTNKAEDYLAKAESDARLLASSPRFLYGNLARMIYFDLNGNLGEVEKAMEDALKHNNRGIIVPPYVTAFYRAGKYKEALERLKALPDDDPFLIQARAFLLMATGELEKAKELCIRSLDQGQTDAMIIDCLFLLGREGEKEAIERARKIYNKIKPLKYWRLRRELIRYRAGPFGEQEEQELAKLAGSSERDKAEVYWLIGLRKLAKGDREGAQASFNEIASSPMFFWSSVMWARAFAERIKASDWPGWLPSQQVVESATSTNASQNDDRYHENEYPLSSWIKKAN